jgi:hypothetical protein
VNHNSLKYSLAASGGAEKKRGMPLEGGCFFLGPIMVIAFSFPGILHWLRVSSAVSAAFAVHPEYD